MKKLTLSQLTGLLFRACDEIPGIAKLHLAQNVARTLNQRMFLCFQALGHE